MQPNQNLKPVPPKPGNGAKPAVTPAPSRMTLESVNDKNDEPTKTLVYGVEGGGKSTWAAGAERPIWLPIENPRLKVKKFPQPTTLTEVYEALAVLMQGGHDFKTLVIDTVDALEPLIWREVCNKNGWETMESPGWGKGFNVAFEEWRRLTSRLDRVIEKTRMDLILIGHCTVRAFNDPNGSNYDRYTLKLFETKESKPGAHLRGWCDNVYFVNYEVSTYEDDRGRTKGQETGQRLLHTEWRAAFDAKNRFSLPPVLPLSWDAYAEALKQNQKQSAA